MVDIVVVGSLNMDLVARAPHFPHPGETLTGESFATFAGGKGANQAAACALLGADTAMIGRVGSDAFGDRLRDGLQALGVETTYIRADADAPTGTAVIIVEDSGENAIVVVPGANGGLGESDVVAAERLLASTGCMVAQLEVPVEPIRQAAAIVRRAGGVVVLNAAPAQPLSGQLLTLVDDLIVNETEASILVGIPVSDMESATHVAQQLRAAGPRCVVVTLGAQGALLVDEQGPWVCPAKAVQVVDTTAAGDAFVGAWAAALTRGESHRSALCYAVAAGTLATTKMGAQPSLPHHEQVTQFMETRDV
ncbi:MAG: ribokinase [Anaerolineae bacterium]